MSLELLEPEEIVVRNTRKRPRRSMAELTALFKKLSPKQRLKRRVSGMCSVGLPLYEACCNDITDLRFFGHHAGGKCPSCFQAFVKRLRTIR